MTNKDIDNFILPRMVKCDTVTAVEPSIRRASHDGEISFSKTYAYRNGLPWPVTIVEQSGIATTIPRIEQFKSTNDLEVEVRYIFNHLVNFDIYHLLDETNTDLSPELKAMQAHAKEGRIRQLSRNEFVISYSLTKDRLNLNSPPIHVKELNLTFFIKKDNDIKQVIHPYSDLGEKLQLEVNNIGSFQYGIEIVDPHNLYGERFINIANHVYRVVPNRTSYKEPGVYVNLTIGSEVLLSNGPGFVADYYTFNEADSALNFYSNAKEAQELGNLEDVAKKKRLELENRIIENKLSYADRDKDLKYMDHDLSLQSKALAEVENRYKLQMQELKNTSAEMDRKTRERDHEHMLVKMERDAMLSNMQFRQTVQKADRSDMSEMIKWIPLIALAFGAIVKSLI